MERSLSVLPRKFAAVVMAAGRGTRMRDTDRAKVMFELNGRPMLHYVLDLAFELGSSRVIVVVGHQRDVVMEYVRASHPDVLFATQTEQLGTGHAVLQSEEALAGFEGDVLVLSGDVPLLTVPTMHRLLAHHFATQAVATILTANVEDPAGYGRIIRNDDGSVKKIVEHRDASEQELRIKEINSGIYLFDKRKLFEGLRHIAPHNAQNEYYLTDVFEYFWRRHWIVSALAARQTSEIHGINSMEQLEEARRIAALGHGERSAPRGGHNP